MAFCTHTNGNSVEAGGESGSQACAFHALRFAAWIHSEDDDHDCCLSRVCSMQDFEVKITDALATDIAAEILSAGSELAEQMCGCSLASFGGASIQEIAEGLSG